MIEIIASAALLSIFYFSFPPVYKFCTVCRITCKSERSEVLGIVKGLTLSEYEMALAILRSGMAYRGGRAYAWQWRGAVECLR